jgi:hypothetical protein
VLIQKQLQSSFPNSKGRKAAHHQTRVNITRSKGNGEFSAGREVLQGNEYYLIVKQSNLVQNWTVG